jgi:ComF family protein
MSSTEVLRAARRWAYLSIRIVGTALSPPTCAACGARLSKLSIFCTSCASTVVASPSRRATAGAAYGGAVAIAIRRFKFDGRDDLAEPLSHLLRRALRRSNARADVIVPVPLHPRRLAERGFNQATLLAREVAPDLGGALLPRALERGRHAPPQASLGRAARLENLAGAFRVREPAAIHGRRVALVDDVVTTGATLAACRVELLRAGAASVISLALAETPDEA